MLQNIFTNISNETISDSLHPGVSEVRFLEPETKKTIFQRISEFDQTAVAECLETYGNYVWAIAKKNTKTTWEAETAVKDIFLDIWKNAEFFNAAKSDEQSFIAHISLKRLLKNKLQGENYE